MEIEMSGRELALKALMEFESKGKTLKDLITERKEKPDKDVQKAYDYFYGTVKMLKRIDYVLSKYLKRKKLEELPIPIRNILREGVYGLLFSEDPDYAVVNESVNLAKKFGHNGTVSLVNGVLRNIHQVDYPDEPVKYLSIYYSFPEFLVRMLMDEYGEEAEDILKESNLPPVTTIRVNALKTTPDEVLIELKEEGFKAEEIENREYNLLTENSVVYSRSFEKGHFQVQGVTQNMNADLLSPKKGEIILDLCSSPGTKSTAIAEIMGDDGVVISVDIKNLDMVVGNAKRLGIKSIFPVKADVRNFYVNKTDRILLDVPCSGTGVMGKRGDIRWKLSKESLNRLVGLQREMLSSASKNLKKNGILVYSTCSILAEENEKQVQWFLEENHDFIVERAAENDTFVKNIPGRPFYDGGFGALIRRR
jgi:16S rRNA (cytosine967-C5)-methyltransferase